MNIFQRHIIDLAGYSSWIASVVRRDKVRQIINIDPFNYNGSVTNLADAATSEINIPIEADSDFVMTQASGYVLVTASGLVNATPNVLVQLTDAGSGKTFMSEGTLFGLVFGNQGFPFVLSSPRVIAPQTSINIQVTNRTGAAADIYVELIGARVYYKGR